MPLSWPINALQLLKAARSDFFFFCTVLLLAFILSHRYGLATESQNGTIKKWTIKCKRIDTDFPVYICTNHIVSWSYYSKRILIQHVFVQDFRTINRLPEYISIKTKTKEHIMTTMYCVVQIIIEVGCIPIRHKSF